MGAEAPLDTTAGPARRPATAPAAQLRTAAIRIRADLVPAACAAALATVIGIWVLQVWNTTLSVPILNDTRDELFNLIMIKDVIQHGWDFTNPNLGAPFGQELYDFPALNGDSFFMLIVKALGTFSGNPAVVLNIFYLLGFPSIALVAYGVLRKLAISTGVALVCAVIYAVLPFRFESGESHVFLSSYFLVPISCYLVLAIFNGSELFARDAWRTGWRQYLTRRSVAVLVLCLVLGSADSYYAAFTIALMASAAILAFLASRHVRPLVCAFLAISTIGGAAALNELPTIIYHIQHGPDPSPEIRSAEEASHFSLSLASMVMPIEGNRIPGLARLAQRYNSTTNVPDSTPEGEPRYTDLGLVGALGLLWLGILLGINCISSRRTAPVTPEGIHAALGAGIAFLIGTVGGLSTVFAYTLSSLFHAPDRTFLFIAFFALFGAALGLDQFRNWIGNRRGGQAVFIASLAATLVGGVLYQTSPSMAPDYAATTASYTVNRQFVHSIEAQLPGDASIFQIPYVPFPVGQKPAAILDNEDLYGYIFSDRLRWTGGAMEGRATDWVPAFITKPLPKILAGVSAVGFDGIYVDRAGLPEKGTELLPALSRQLGVSPLMSSDGRLAFFNMTAYNRRFRLRHSPSQISSIAHAALYPRS